MAAAPPAPKVRSILFWVVLISVGLHVLAGVILGSWTIYQYTRPAEATFESPPPAVKVPPQAIEYRVQMQQMQKQSARPQNQVSAQTERLLNQEVSNIAAHMPAVVAPALAGAPVVAAGGRAGGGRIGGSGLGFGMSAVNFFGIRKQGERVVFVIDAGASMVEPQRGDLPGYERVKRELVGMIDGLSPGTFFNVIVFERGVDVFEPRLVVATPENKAKVSDWIGPYWRLDRSQIERRGTFRRNYEPKMGDWVSDGGSSRLDLALVAALEMGPDLIFMITDGTPSVQKGFSAQQEEAHRAALARYRADRARYEASPAGQRELADYQARLAAWRAGQEKQNAERKRRGLPPVVREGGSSGVRQPGPRPPQRDTGYYSGEEIVRMVRARAQELYRRDHRPPPTVNIVGYSANDNAQAFIRRLALGFPGSTTRNLGKFDADTKF